MPSSLNEAAPAGRVLTGRMVLAMLLGFFVTGGAANFGWVGFAFQTFRGLASNHAYTDGLAYNNEIQAAHDQDSLGWQVKGSLSRIAPGLTRVLVTQANAQGRPADKVEVNLQFAHPADRVRDRALALSMQQAGVYAGEIAIEPGRWELTLRISENGQTVFQSHNKVEISDQIR